MAEGSLVFERATGLMALKQAVLMYEGALEQLAPSSERTAERKLQEALIEAGECPSTSLTWPALRGLQRQLTLSQGHVK